MRMFDVDENTFYIEVPKDAFDFSLYFSGMLFFKRLINFSIQTRTYTEVKKFCYLPNKYSGEKEIIDLVKEEKINKLFIKVIR